MLTLMLGIGKLVLIVAVPLVLAGWFAYVDEKRAERNVDKVLSKTMLFYRSESEKDMKRMGVR